MQLKTLIVLAVIAIICVGMAFILVSKGYIRIGAPGQDQAAQQAEGVTDPEALADEEESELEEEMQEELEELEAKQDGEDGDGRVLTVIPLEPIIVNLKGSFGRRYLKTTINLGVEAIKTKDDEEDEDKKKKKKKKEEEEGAGDTELKAEIEGKMVEIKDVLISILSAKSIEDVEGWSDQNLIREEIKDILNSQLHLNAKVRKVFFTEFVVQ